LRGTALKSLLQLKKRQAEKAVEKGAGPNDKEREEALKKETERLRIEKEKKESEEKATKAASRARLSQRAQLWNKGDQ
jgi:hypothetical protein